jgi:hypothetical protein
VAQALLLQGRVEEDAAGVQQAVEAAARGAQEHRLEVALEGNIAPAAKNVHF